MTGGVTIVIAAYNEERHIRACLDSLRAQTFQPLDIIVVDDGSTDRTPTIARGYDGVRLLARPHRGKALAVNDGVAAASGEVVFFLDADLTFAPDYVARLAEPILRGEVVGTSHTDEFVANPENVWSRCLMHLWGLPDNRRVMVPPEELGAGSVIYRAVRRDRFLAVGGFDDIGFLDDQTLAPKLGERARWIEGPRCYHHNPDRLADVWSSGTWAGKSEFVRHGPRAMLRYLPPFSLWRAATDAARTGFAPLAVYRVIYDTGVVWGIARRWIGIDRSGGK